MNRLSVAAAAWLTPAFVFAQEAQEGAREEAVRSALNNENVKVILEGQGGFFSPEIFVPLTFFLFIFGVVFSVYYWRYRQTKEVQSSIRLMVEKGVEVPLELIVPKVKSSYRTDVRKGVMLILLGIVLPIALAVSDPSGRAWVWGLIPLAMGTAYLISARLAARSN